MATLDELKAVEGKEVVMTVTIDGVSHEKEKFKIQGALPQGVVIFSKKTGPRLIEDFNSITDLETPKVEPKKPKVKTLKPVDTDGVSAHLLNAHGATVEYVTETSPEDLIKWHDETHSKYNLGHVHKDADAETAAETQPAEASAA